MDGFVAAIEQYRDQFYRFVLRNTWDTSAAEDVFSSAVLAAFENRHRFTPGTNFRAWMFRILANKCFVANRETLRDGGPLRDETLDALPASMPSHDTAIMEDPEAFLEQCGDEVFNAFKRLSTAQRTCILLKDIEHFSCQEIAGILEIPVATVMTHLARGRAKLRNELQEYARNAGIIRPVLWPPPREKCTKISYATGS